MIAVPCWNEPFWEERDHVVPTVEDLVDALPAPTDLPFNDA
jgi:hypothetical protein